MNVLRTGAGWVAGGTAAVMAAHTIYTGYKLGKVAIFAVLHRFAKEEGDEELDFNLKGRAVALLKSVAWTLGAGVVLHTLHHFVGVSGKAVNKLLRFTPIKISNHSPIFAFVQKTVWGAKKVAE